MLTSSFENRLFGKPVVKALLFHGATLSNSFRYGYQKNPTFYNRGVCSLPCNGTAVVFQDYEDCSFYWLPPVIRSCVRRISTRPTQVDSWSNWLLCVFEFPHSNIVPPFLFSMSNVCCWWLSRLRWVSDWWVKGHHYAPLLTPSMMMMMMMKPVENVWCGNYIWRFYSETPCVIKSSEVSVVENTDIFHVLLLQRVETGRDLVTTSACGQGLYILHTKNMSKGKLHPLIHMHHYEKPECYNMVPTFQHFLIHIWSAHLYSKQSTLHIPMML